MQTLELTSEMLLSSFMALVETRSARVGIVGLGYVGLPLAEAFTSRGFPVLGFDVDKDKVARLEAGESSLTHIPDETVRGMRCLGFHATADFGRLEEMDAVLLCVPTPLSDSRDPDLSFVERSAQACAGWLRARQLIVLESTTYPGTTRQVVRPILEATGLRAGRDFFLAYSPERQDPGSPLFETAAIPKVVGAVDPLSQRAALALYDAVFEQTVPVSSTEVAEASKVLENTYRAVNIALVNELKLLFERMGIDVWEVIDAASTKPFGFQPFYPGPGLGGHCIPVDPFYLAWAARRHGLATRFIELAGEINAAMPAYVVHRLAAALNEGGLPLKGSRIALLGVAYKRDVGDCRESPGQALFELLQSQGALVSYHDPHVPELPASRRHPGLCARSQPLDEDYLKAQDCVLIVTDHGGIDWDWVVAHSRLVVDTRNATRQVARHRDRIVRA
jgi:UDP-N-acetyl-D-glucosamine dehydrogenase